MPLSAALRSEMPGSILRDKRLAPSVLLSKCLCQPRCSLLWHLHRWLYRRQPLPQALRALLFKHRWHPRCSLLWHPHRCLYRHQLQCQRSLTGTTGALRKHHCQRPSSRQFRRQYRFPCQHQIRRLFPSLCQRRSRMQCSRLRSRLIRLQHSRLLWHGHPQQCPCHLSQRSNKPFLYLLSL